MSDFDVLPVGIHASLLTADFYFRRLFYAKRQKESTSSALKLKKSDVIFAVLKILFTFATLL